MNKSIYRIVLATVCLAASISAPAQVRLADYVMIADNNQNMFNSIANVGTRMSFSSTDDGYATCTLPFDMPFGTTTIASGSRIACSANGFFYLGESSTSGTSCSSPGTHKVINPILAQDAHMGRNSSSAAYYYHNTADSSFIIEYKDFATYSSPYAQINFQVVLRPSGNISIIFGSITNTSAVSNPKCYLANTSSDIISLSGTWASPSQATSVTSMPASPMPAYMQYNFYRVFGTCPPPTSFRTSNITADSCTLHWCEIGQSTTWILEYADSAFHPGCYQGTQVYAYDTIYYLDNLSPNTTYHVYLHSDCGGDTSLNRYISFTTNCVATQRSSLPITENFESGTISRCWNRRCVMNNTISDGTANAYISSTYASSGSRSLYFYAYNSSNNMTVYTILPMMEDSVGGLDIVFDMYQSSSASIKVVTMSDPDNLSTYHVVRTINTDASSRWVNYETPLINLPHGHRYVALAAEQQSSSVTTYIDNVTLMLHSTCPRPQSLVLVGAASAASTNVAWHGNDPNVYQWNVVLVSQGGNPDTCQNILTVYDTTYQFQNLRSGAAYDVYVRSDCGTETSQWRGPLNFVTGVYEMHTSGIDSMTTCSAVIVDDGGINGSYSNSCNSTLIIRADDPTSTLSITGSYYTESSCDKLYIYDGAGTSGTQLRLCQGSGTVSALTSTGNAMTLVFTSDGSVTYSGFQLTVSCVGGSGGGGGGGGTAPCDLPTTLTTQSTTQSTATVTWRENGNFQVACKESSASNWGTPVEVSASTYTFTGLNPSTQYDWRVCKVCSNGGISDWAQSSFTTAEDVPPVPCDHPIRIRITNITTNSAYLSWVGSGSFELSYRLDPADAWSASLPITTNYFTMDMLQPSTQYYWRVRKVCSSNSASDWVDTSFTTLDPDPEGIAASYDDGTAIAIYPNPAQAGSQVAVAIGGAEGLVTVSMMDVTGRIVHSAAQTCNAGCTLRFDLPAVAMGTYFLRVQTPLRTVVEKLIVK